ncbi:MAG: division/cell wall cluster transcriptional repressor MraZ [Flavobacteriaceae bacterium]|nr:division/cell wall cluster transcriptional repressor MraZ [Flavobacteriaceae bacterium]
MLNLIGTYHCKADTKGRVMVPADLKKQLAAVATSGFVIKRAVFQPCLELYPMEEWQKLMQRVSGLNRFNRKNNDFIRRFTAGVRTVEMDATGRLNIPRDLMDFAEIDKDIVVSSAISIVEIWDAAKYEKAINEAATDFADLAEEVMGGGNDIDDGIS